MLLACDLGRWTVLTAAAFAITLGLPAPRLARASCSGPEYGLLWSYPANGAMNVPIDADLFVSGELSGLPSLDGEPLPRIASGVYDLGPLEPQTRYEVRWEGAVVAFTTGEAVAPSPLEPSSDVRVTRQPVDVTRCPLVPPQGCFDTGNRTAVRFDAGLSRAWLLDVLACDGSVRQMVWPSACGLPVVETEERIVCVSARSTQGAGLSESTGLICSAPDVPPGTLPRSSGCQGAWPPEGALTLLAEDGVTLGSLSGGEASPEPVSASDPSAPLPLPAAGCAFTHGLFGRAGAGGLAGIGLAALLAWLRRRSDPRPPRGSPAALDG